MITPLQILSMSFGIFIFVGAIGYMLLNVVMGAAGAPTDDHPFIGGMVFIVISFFLIWMSGIG